MTVKVEALEYNGKLFRTETEVLNYRAVEALRKVYRNDLGIYDARFSALLSNPYKAYLILSEIYNDR